MKSKEPPVGGGSNKGEPEEDLTVEQLAKIGAIALTFNYAEYALERVLFYSLNLPGNLWIDAIKRLGGIDTKVELSKISVDFFDRIVTLGYARPDLSFKTEYQNSIGAFSVCKQYRDLILHSMIYNSDPTIGKKFGYKGEQTAQHVVMTFDALCRMHSEIKSVRREFEVTERLCSLLRPTVMSYGEATFSQPIPLEAADCLVKLRSLQKSRHELGDYPTLPGSV